MDGFLLQMLLFLVTLVVAYGFAPVPGGDPACNFIVWARRIRAWWRR